MKVILQLCRSDILALREWYLRIAKVIFLAYAKSDIAPLAQLWSIPYSAYSKIADVAL